MRYLGAAKITLNSGGQEHESASKLSVVCHEIHRGRDRGIDTTETAKRASPCVSLQGHLYFKFAVYFEGETRTLWGRTTAAAAVEEREANDAEAMQAKFLTLLLLFSA